MRLKSGIPGFDELLEGGLIQNQIYLVSGVPGSGRTTFGIQFLAQGASQDEKGLFVAFTNNPTDIIKNMSRFNFNIIELVKNKKIFFMSAAQELFGADTDKSDTSQDKIFDLTATQATSKNVLDKIEPIITKTGIKRLVLDSTAVLPMAVKGREREFDEKQIFRVMNMFKDLGVTVLLLSEHNDPRSFRLEHYLAQGVIFLHNPLDPEHDSQRAIQIVKMRGTKHDCKLHPISFAENGLTVL